MLEEKKYIKKRSRKRSASRTALFDPFAVEKYCDNPVTVSILAGITAPLGPSSATAVAAIRAYFDLLLSRFPSEPVAQADVSNEDLLFPMDDLPISSELFSFDDPLSAQFSLRAPRRSPNPSISSAELTYSSDADEDIEVDISSDEKSSEASVDHAAILSAYHLLVSRWRLALQDPERGDSSQEDLILLSQLIGHALLLFEFVHHDITENLPCYPQVMDLKQWRQEASDSMVGPIASISQPIPIPKRSQSQHAARHISSQSRSDRDSRSGSWGRF
jgi:hypothetical protein